MGLFDRLKQGLAKTKQILRTDVRDLFRSGQILDDALLQDFEARLIRTDMGVSAAMGMSGIGGVATGGVGALGSSTSGGGADIGTAATTGSKGAMMDGAASGGANIACDAGWVTSGAATTDLTGGSGSTG